MSRINTAVMPVNDVNHEGSPVRAIRDPLTQLRRYVLSTLLWENGYYIDGVDVGDAIAKLVPEIPARQLLDLAVEARTKQKLRHIPLFLLREAARRKDMRGQDSILSEAIAATIQRADELAEFLAIYWKDKREPLAKQVKLGLAKAFSKFDEYQLAKWNQNTKVKLRDVLFLAHAKPKNDEQAALWKRLVDNELKTPDTWEVGLSAGAGEKSTADKKERWTRLLSEHKLMAMALIKNLRNFVEAGVDPALVRQELLASDPDKVLPFRFISAAKYAPKFEQELEAMMFKNVAGTPKLKGTTALVVDTSPSMWQAKLSERSEMDRFEAAAALAMLLREICDSVNIYAFNERGYRVPPRRGFALRDALAATKDGASRGGLAVDMADADGYDRIIVLTDGEWHPKSGTAGYSLTKPTDICPNPLAGKPGYMVNMAATRNGVGYGPWISIDGWSEAIVDYVMEEEQLLA
jgi:60 kDa SS-A/Ro ribonucleoprotein